MNPFEIILAATAQGDAAVTAKNLSMNIGVDAGNISVSGQQTMVLINGSEVTNSLPLNSIRMAELETLIAGMQDGPDKTKAQAKLDIWNTFNEAVKPLLETALKAQYELDNPQTT